MITTTTIATATPTNACWSRATSTPITTATARSAARRSRSVRTTRARQPRTTIATTKTPGVSGNARALRRARQRLRRRAGASGRGTPIAWYVDADGDGFGVTSANRRLVQAAAVCGGVPRRAEPGAVRAADPDALPAPPKARSCAFAPRCGRLRRLRPGDVSGSRGTLRRQRRRLQRPRRLRVEHERLRGRRWRWRRGRDVQARMRVTAMTIRAHGQPARTEICDELDNDCDDQIDEDVTSTQYWSDSDGDGYGDASAFPIEACVQAPGTAPNGDDCDDGNAERNPGRAEICNTRDEDCDAKRTRTWTRAEGHARERPCRTRRGRRRGAQRSRQPLRRARRVDRPDGKLRVRFIQPARAGGHRRWFGRSARGQRPRGHRARDLGAEHRSDRAARQQYALERDRRSRTA